MRVLYSLMIFAPLGMAACSDSNGTSPTASVPSPTTTTASPATTTTSPTTTTTTAPTQRVLRTTTFQGANGYQTAGTARIVRTGDSFALELLDDFRTSQSPVLDVRLCNDPNCRNGAMANFGDLKSFSGAQTYPLPDNGSQYSHAVIYCRGVRLAFGFGALR